MDRPSFISTHKVQKILHVSECIEKTVIWGENIHIGSNTNINVKGKTHPNNWERHDIFTQNIKMIGVWFLHL